MNTMNPAINVMKVCAPEVQRARRATGAMFFSVFGGAWLAGWAYSSHAPLLAFILIAAIALALLGTAVSIYRRHAAALKAEPETPERRRAERIFHLVNGGQWVVMIVLGNVLANIGLGMWTIPMIVFVVGLHFLPIAYVFRHPVHYVTGAALCTFAAIYPLVAPAGPVDPVGFMGAGLILWASAAWALKRPSVRP